MNRQYFLAIFGILALMVFVAGCTTKAPHPLLPERAHTIVDGKNYWSEEKILMVTPQEQISQSPEQMPAPPMSSGGGY